MIAYYNSIEDSQYLIGVNPLGFFIPLGGAESLFLFKLVVSRTYAINNISIWNVIDIKVSNSLFVLNISEDHNFCTMTIIIQALDILKWGNFWKCFPLILEGMEITRHENLISHKIRKQIQNFDTFSMKRHATQPIYMSGLVVGIYV